MGLLVCTVASAADVACYQNEIDPSTRRIYASESEYESDLEELLHRRQPPDPGLFKLAFAYKVYKEAAAEQQFRTDKVAHCYMGCLLASRVDEETATYAAWYKEVKDLTDCNRKTHFEWEDIKATERGIRLARTPHQNARLFCRKQCR